jgi:hypothetical protein
MSHRVISGEQEIGRREFLEKLSELPIKTRNSRNEKTLFSLVAQCYEELKSAKERGYTYEELAIFLKAEAKVSTTAGTLRKYMNRVAKEMIDTSVSSVKNSIVSEDLEARTKKISISKGNQLSLLRSRPTLYTRGTDAQVREDEFENL